MRVCIELAHGPSGRERVTKRALLLNINAQKRAAANASMADMQLLMDTLSILTAIQKELPEESK